MIGASARAWLEDIRATELGLVEWIAESAMQNALSLFNQRSVRQSPLISIDSGRISFEDLSVQLAGA